MLESQGMHETRDGDDESYGSISPDTKFLLKKIDKLWKHQHLYITKDTFYRLYYVLILLLCAILGMNFYSVMQPRVNASYWMIDEGVVQKNDTGVITHLEKITEIIQKGLTANQHQRIDKPDVPIKP